LREREAQVGADADHPETLLGPLTGDLRIHGKKAAGDPRSGCRVDDPLEHRLKRFLAGVGSVGRPHLGLQIPGADEGGVDSWNTINLVGVLNARGTLSLHDHKDFIIGTVIVLIGRSCPYRQPNPG